MEDKRDFSESLNNSSATNTLESSSGYPNYMLMNSEIWIFRTTKAKNYQQFIKAVMDRLIKRVVFFESRIPFFQKKENDEMHGIIIMPKTCYRRELPEFYQNQKIR